MQGVFASTGAFIGRPNGRDYRLIESLSKNIDCDGFELMFYADWYGKERNIAEFLSNIGVKFPTFHCEKGIGELLAEERFPEAYEKFEINCETAKKVGSKLMVIHLWNGPTSDRNIGANFSAYPKLENIAERYGITPTVENVIARGGSPIRLWHRLLKTSPGAFFTYDTKMAQFDLDNEKAFLPENIRLWERVKHMHINDRIGGYRDWSSYRALNLGEGDVDFDLVFRGLKEVGYRGDFTVEASAFLPDGSLDLAGLNESLKTLKKFISRYLSENPTEN